MSEDAIIRIVFSAPLEASGIEDSGTADYTTDRTVLNLCFTVTRGEISATLSAKLP